jgi:hypothetical protein
MMRPLSLLAAAKGFQVITMLAQLKGYYVQFNLKLHATFVHLK